MPNGRKRPRSEPDESRAECPFTVVYVSAQDKDKKPGKRRRQSPDGEEKPLQQLSPFTPTGRFKTHENMDLYYKVEPYKAWMEMTRYNSFVLNGQKYFSEGFINVANDSTVEKQRSLTTRDGPEQPPRRRSQDEWVARILEIRASDEHHVYARVYWMYWPDELWAGTKDGNKIVQGRQPYHGKSELIASNHMDIINVVSVTSPANVNQWIEENDDEIQDALYWRQAFDYRTLELSSVEPTCKCGNPANPDNTLIGCTSQDCNKWLHVECLLHDVLMKTYERLGKDTPHKAAEPLLKDLREEDEAGTRPLSPKEPSISETPQQTIDVRSDDMVQENVEDNVLVREDDEIPVAHSQEDNDSGPNSSDMKGVAVRKARQRKKSYGPEASEKPYLGLFEASLVQDATIPTVQIKDLRENITGGEKTWKEGLSCLVCGTQIN